MGTDCKAYIKPVAKVQDILKVSAILLGAEKIIENHDYQKEKFQTLNMKPEAFTLILGSLSELKNNLIYKYDGFMQLIINDRFGQSNRFFIEPQSNSKGEMYFSGRSTPLSIALSSKLIEIFGGKLYSSDSDMNLDKEVDIGIWEPEFTDNENEGFVNKNKFLINLQPLNQQDLQKARKLAAYTYSESEMRELTDRFNKYAIVEFAEKIDKSLEIKNPIKKKKI